MATGLDDPLVFAGGFDTPLCLGDRQCEGLFAINVFARFTGLDDRGRMPMIWGCNADRINVITSNDFAIVIVGIATIEL